MNLEQEILEARGKNWAKLVSQRADQITEQRKYDDDLMIQILNGDIFDEAINQIALEIQMGLYDKMLIPIECNLQGYQMTTNYEKIKAMNIDEMADYLCAKEDDCDYCLYRFGLDNFQKTACKYVKKKLSQQWLESEAE